jgi:hypothetical protein
MFQRTARRCGSRRNAHWAVVDLESGILLGRAALKHLKFLDGTAISAREGELMGLLA